VGCCIVTRTSILPSNPHLQLSRGGATFPRGPPSSSSSLSLFLSASPKPSSRPRRGATVESSVPSCARGSLSARDPRFGVDPRVFPNGRRVRALRACGRTGAAAFSRSTLTVLQGFDTFVRALIASRRQALVFGVMASERKADRCASSPRPLPCTPFSFSSREKSTTRRFAPAPRGPCDGCGLPSRERIRGLSWCLFEVDSATPSLLGVSFPGSVHVRVWLSFPALLSFFPPVRPLSPFALLFSPSLPPPEPREPWDPLGANVYEREFDLGIVRAAWAGSTLSPPSSRRGRCAVARRGRVPHAAPPAAGPPGGVPWSTFPALNEADCIGEVIKHVRRAGQRRHLVVDDGSSDDTAADRTPGRSVR